MYAILYATRITNYTKLVYIRFNENIINYKHLIEIHINFYGFMYLIHLLLLLLLCSWFCFVFECEMNIKTKPRFCELSLVKPQDREKNWFGSRIEVMYESASHTYEYITHFIQLWSNVTFNCNYPVSSIQSRV